jgi:serine/threonine-protein kinase
MEHGTQLAAAIGDRYEIDREIGRGGMATVYLARDKRHNRRVALKVLDPELGAVIGTERFLTEIQVTANLQHPNILPLYDSGSGNGLLFYVMPYVEGESLRDLLNRERQLSVENALRITTAVAAALDYAHRHSIIHRDLKPENILLQDGQPLVADFGIALALTNAGGSRITQTGLSLGTPQYMSPEQATGERVIDGRTDIYSLGCVLYEMLAGEPPYLGGSTQAVIAKLLTEKPASVRTVRDTVPAHVDYAIERALAKVPADRWATPHDFADALAGRAATPVIAAASRRNRGRSFAVAALPWAVAAGAAFWALSKGRSHGVAVPATMYASLPGASLLDGYALSHDGRAIAYVGGASGATKQLHLRPLGQLDARALNGTDGARLPVWSPDDRRVAFASNAKVMRVSADGGAPETVSSTEAYGFDWLDNEAMVLGSTPAGSGLRIADHPGAPTRVLTQPEIATGDMFHANPVVMSNERVAFISWGPGGIEDDFLSVADLNTGKFVRSTVRAFKPVTFADGWIIYQSHDRRLMAVRCDLGAMRLDGAPVTVAEDVVSASITASAALFVSGARTTSLTRVPATGRGAQRVLVNDPGTIAAPRVSPDGQRIAYVVTGRDNSTLAVYDPRAGTSTMLRSAPYLNEPAWFPGGHEIMYYEMGADSGLWRMSVDRPSERRRVTLADFPREPIVTPDGGSLVFMANVKTPSGTRGYQMMQMSLSGTGAPSPVMAGRFEETHPSISPNGHWLAASSGETGRNEVFVRPFGPGAAGPSIRVSLDGGYEPRWSRDGQRLYYRFGGRIISAGLREAGGRLEVVSRDSVGTVTLATENEYDFLFDVAPDGELVLATANDTPSQLVFAEEWLAAVRKKLLATKK